MICNKEDKAYIEDRDLWTGKEARQIGHSAWHFRQNFATPSPSPDRDKTTELKSIDLFSIGRKKMSALFFLQIEGYLYQKTQNVTLIPNQKAKLEEEKNARQKCIIKKLLFS